MLAPLYRDQTLLKKPAVNFGGFLYCCVMIDLTKNRRGAGSTARDGPNPISEFIFIM